MPTDRTPEVCKGALSCLQLRTDQKLCVRKPRKTGEEPPKWIKGNSALQPPGTQLGLGRCLFSPVSRMESLIHLVTWGK